MGDLVNRTFFIILLLGLALPSLVATAGSDLANAMQEEAPRHEYILQLLSHGANPNITVNGCPLIIYVTMKLVRKKTADETKWYELLKTLLNHRAHVDELDTNYYTALMYAAYYGHYEAVSLLLCHNAQADFCNAHNKTAVSVAQEGRASSLTDEQKERYTKIIALLSYYSNKAD